MRRAAGGLLAKACPIAYRTDPSILRDDPPLVGSNTIYIAGGLYGNPFAAEAIAEMAHREDGRVVFNGDFHFFDYDKTDFLHVQGIVEDNWATMGNIELELSTLRTPDGGCGCHYPEYVSDNVQRWANLIVQRLQKTADGHPDIRESLAALPKMANVWVGGHKVSVLHGDPQQLSGWRLSVEQMDPPDEYLRRSLCGNDIAAGRRLPVTRRKTIEQWMDAADTRVLATTHTCLPFAQRLGTKRGIINNGSAGIPNFTKMTSPLVTRVSTEPRHDQALYYFRIDNLWVEAVPVQVDQEKVQAWFEKNWPKGSAASRSYGQRMEQGPDWTIRQAARHGTKVVPNFLSKETDPRNPMRNYVNPVVPGFAADQKQSKYIAGHGAYIPG
jgi:hypothetical protein